MMAARIWRGVREDLTPSRIPNLNAILLPNTQTSRRKGDPFECGGEASAFEVAALRRRYESGRGLDRKSGSFAPALKKSSAQESRSFECSTCLIGGCPLRSRF